MKDILYQLLSSIVEQEDKVAIEEKEEEGTLFLTISVAPEEVGKIIGKEGKVIRAIRNAMKIPAMKENKRVRIGLAESLQ